MTDKQADSESAQQPTPPEPGAQPHARPEPAARARLMEWQGPAFWMSCGALLAGLAAGAVVLAQRVGVERDLMAVANTLPQSERPAQAPPAPAAAPQRKALAQPEAETAEKPAPAALAGASSQDAAVAKPMALPRPKARSAGSVAKHATRHASAKPPSHKKALARRKAAVQTEMYSGVFKRCPWLGEPGAVECRRHICNGAESEGPACKPYRSKQR